MKLGITAFFFCLIITCTAQTDTAIYNVQLYDGSSFNCTVLEEKKGEYLKVLKSDSAIVVYDWASVEDYKRLEKKKTEDVKTKINAVEMTKYKDWYNCLVLSHGDTLHALIKPKEEYCKVTPFTVLLESRKERTLRPDQIAGLWILNRHDTIRYISIKVSGRDINPLYRIIIDGPCKLLYSEGVKVANITSLGSLSYYGVYSVSYKGQFWDAYIPNENVNSVVTGGGGVATLLIVNNKSEFKQMCREIYNDCGNIQLAYRIETEQYKEQDVENVIRQFNKCLSEKQK